MLHQYFAQLARNKVEYRGGKAHTISGSCPVGKVAEHSIRDKIWIPGTKNECVEDKLLVQKTSDANHGDCQRRAQEMFSQFRKMVKKRHLIAFVFVLLIEWHSLVVFEGRECLKHSLTAQM